MISGFRDYREPRDWRRWKEPAGLICCCTTSSLCANCATSRFTDDFTSALGGYTTTACPGSSGTPVYVASGGFLTQTAAFGGVIASGVYTQGITTPTLNGLCISVCAQIYSAAGKTTGGTGVTIGGGAEFHGRYLAGVKNNYVSQPTTSANGCISGAGASTFAPTWVDGDTITLVITDTSSGAGTYDVTCYVNGVLKKTLAAQAYSFTAGSTIQCGVCDSNGGKWANLKIYTS